ncbi:GIN domain-containing protein [Microbacterium aurum]
MSGAGAFGRTGTIEIRGSGSATLTGVETDDLTVTVVGSGDVTVEGASESLQLTLDGSADVDAGDLRTKTASASLRGSADARVHVSEDLDATVSGSSELVYTGDPPHRSQEAPAAAVRSLPAEPRSHARLGRGDAHRRGRGAHG